MSNLPKQWVPHSYQEDAVQWIIDGYYREHCFALFLDPGLGKTSITIEAFMRLKALGEVKSLLIVGPLNVIKMSWPLELKKWVNFYDVTYTILHGPNKHANLKKKVDLYFINYEGLPWLLEQKWGGVDGIIFDELTRMKNWSAVRTKAVKHFLPAFKLRGGLTGTPIPNGYIDLFSQVYMLDIGKRFGHRKTHFEDRYFEPPSAYSFKRKPLPFAAQEISDKLKDLAFRIDGHKYIDLPEVIYNKIYLDLPKELKEQYEYLKKECLLELENGDVITTVSAAAKSNKLRQFLAGCVYDENRNVRYIHSVKFEALQEFIDDLNGKPVLVGYHYQFEVPILKQLFAKDLTLIGKGQSETQLQDIANKWNSRQIPILAGHPQSIGYGLNLQEATDIIAFSTLDFSADPHIQFVKRVARQGQKSKVVVVHCFLFRDTIDEYLFEILTGKEFEQKDFLSYFAS